MKHELCNAIFIGDSILDVGHALGCYPRGLIGGQVPITEKEFPFIRHLECVLCVMGPKRKLLLSAYEKMGIERIIIENSDSNPNPATIAYELREEGLNVEILDFTQGMESVFEQAGQLFNCPKEAEKAFKKYTIAKAEFAENVLQLNKKVLVLLGLTRSIKEEGFLLLETPNSFLDKAILHPLGCRNVGEALLQEDAIIALDGIQKIENINILINGLFEAKPDVIALTGVANVGLSALEQAVKQTPSLATEVPALAQHAIYSLPHCCSSLPASLPFIQKEWAHTLSKRPWLFQ